MTYKASEFKLTWNGIEVSDGWSDIEFLTATKPAGKDLDTLAEIPVRNVNLCKYNDCGWCYYKDSIESNDENGQCNKHMSCEVYDEKL